MRINDCINITRGAPQLCTMRGVTSNDEMTGERKTHHLNSFMLLQQLGRLWKKKKQQQQQQQDHRNKTTTATTTTAIATVLKTTTTTKVKE